MKTKKIKSNYIYLRKYDKQRLNSRCLICKKMFYVLEIHHIDRNRKNNKEDNFIFVCKKCHTSIHHSYLKEFDRIKNKVSPNAQEKKLLIRKYQSSLKNSQEK